MASKTAGLKLVVKSTNEIILYSAKGTKEIGRFLNGVLQDIYWVYGGEKVLAKLAGIQYIVDNNTVKGALEIVEVEGKTGLKISGKGVLNGSGPLPGVFELSSRIKSVAQFKNYYPKEGAIEFIFDTESKTFLVGKTSYGPLALSPHQKLAYQLNNEVLSHNNNIKIIGGIFQRTADGSVLLKELSGHFYENYDRIPGVKEELKSFLETMTGLKVLWQ